MLGILKAGEYERSELPAKHARGNDFNVLGGARGVRSRKSPSGVVPEHFAPIPAPIG